MPEPPMMPNTARVMPAPPRSLLSRSRGEAMPVLRRFWNGGWGAQGVVREGTRAPRIQCRPGEGRDPQPQGVVWRRFVVRYYDHPRSMDSAVWVPAFAGTTG